MTTFRAIAAVAALSVASLSSALPAGPKTTVKAPKAQAQAPKAHTQAPKATTKAAKATTAPKSGKASTATASASPTADAPTTTPPVAPNALATKISGKPEQLARIQPMLPQGMTLEQATAGFRNQGQFMAALNASKNRSINFVDLQKAMTVDGLSLGQAVKKLSTPPPAPTTPPPGDSL